MDGRRPRVLVASDSAITRAGLGALVRQSDRLEAAGECGLADTAATVHSEGPDVLILDVSELEDPSSVVGRLTAEFQSIAVVAMAESGRRSVVAESLRSGAAAWLLRSVSGGAIEAAALAAASGLTVLDDRIVDSLLAERPEDQGRAQSGEQLTTRELEVMRLLARGYASKTIGRELGISEHTAKFHVSAILGKLGASSRTEAVTTAIRLGLIAV